MYLWGRLDKEILRKVRIKLCKLGDKRFKRLYLFLENYLFFSVLLRWKARREMKEENVGERC